MRTAECVRKSTTEQKDFLEELANLSEDKNRRAHFWKRHEEWFPPGAFSVMQVAAAAYDHPCGARTPESDEEARDSAIREMHWLIREAWAIPNSDFQRKKWKISRLRGRFHQLCVPKYELMNEPPFFSQMDEALRSLPRLM